MQSSSRVVSTYEWESAQTVPPDHVPNVFKIDEITVAKVDLDEARAKSEVAAMELALSQTTMPIPQIYNCYKVEETQRWCILMEFVEGERLQEIYDDANSQWKSGIIHQLKGFMRELHAVKGQSIGAVDATRAKINFLTTKRNPMVLSRLNLTSTMP